jgi:dsDNA-specific endonuclease/ATPase MutS2
MIIFVMHSKWGLHMMDIANQRLVHLATAQESIYDVTKMIEQWEQSQAELEKNAFDTMNMSDSILNLSKEGKKIVERLQEYFLTPMAETGEEDASLVAMLLQDVQGMFDRIVDHSFCANETAHILENEVAKQREIGEDMKKQVCRVIDEIDSCAACEEFLFAEI